MDEKLTEDIHIRLSDSDYKQIAQLAKDDGSRSVSSLVRKWVLAALYFAVSGKKGKQ
jgi:hypothetical protein